MAITQCSCLFSPSSPFNLTTLIAKTCEDQAKHRTLLLFIRVRNLTNAASTYAKTANVDEIHLLFWTCLGAPQQVTGPPGVDSVWHGMASCSAHGTVGQLDPLDPFDGLPHPRKAQASRPEIAQIAVWTPPSHPGPSFTKNIIFRETVYAYYAYMITYIYIWYITIDTSII